MPELILGVALLASWAFHVYQQSQWTKERSRLVNRLIARTPMEAKSLDAPVRRPPRVPPEPKLPDGYEGQIGL